jgi:type IV pilus assembly protein PilW
VIVHRNGDSKGFSLIEFMVAILLGTILIGGAASVYLGSKRAYTEVEQVASLSENARFSMVLLKHSLRHAGFYGPGGLGTVAPDPDLDAVAGDCTGMAAAYDTVNYLFATQAAGAAVLGCIDDAVPGTDVLVVKYAEPEPLYDANPADASAARDGVISFPRGLSGEDTYLVSNSEGSLLFDGADATASFPSVAVGEVYANGIAFPYRTYVYYVRNTAPAPTLARKVLEWDATAGGMRIGTQNLVEGVENLQFLFGEDTDLDGEPDGFANHTGVTNWASVIEVRAFLLIQSATEDVNFTDDRTYRLGDVTVPAAGDNRRRLLSQADITLRNPRLILRGGA